ncbi:DUF4190 domain-containing protein [Isoptericola dokdonensis]|uniref:DUF4190 domain-containing protein n=1 Tax=Isoptericola dokdonensis DS-3 TaxID=1300344 RepID=A0A168F704_9MICO|nr:DUF4190 domain-containing protein [Isoptericola dokdonensis]ANC30968.1 hypothetical protein I598_1410 [Isoptericola dokdonensis DS-3]
MTAPFPQAPAPAAPPVPPAKGNALAVAGFVVALVSLVTCLVPIVNNLAFLGAVVGLALAVVGVVKARKGAPRGGLAVAGVVLAVLAGIGVLASQAFYGKVVDEVSAELSDLPTADDDGTAVEDAAADAPPAGTAQDDVQDTAQDAAPAAAADGTREHPYRFSQDVSTDDWTVDLGRPYEAWDEIRAENEFNDAPADGTEFWIVPVRATYTGTETGTPWVDLTVEFVGDDSVTYSDYCGVIPDDLMDTDELYEGGTAQGNVCVAVPAGAPGAWTLTAGWFSDPVFFATAR